MKATKALLALAIMMVAIMPSCKKEDFTKSSTNPYIAIFKTAEESIGKKTEDSDKLMKEAGWSYDAQTAWWSKKVDDLKFTVQYAYNANGVIYDAEFYIESANGKTKTYSEKNYISCLNMIGQSYPINGKACEFTLAGYGDNKETPDVKFEKYEDFKKAFKKFVAAKASEAQWGSLETTSVTIGGVIDGGIDRWGGIINDASIAK